MGRVGAVGERGERQPCGVQVGAEGAEAGDATGQGERGGPGGAQRLGERPVEAVGEQRQRGADRAGGDGAARDVVDGGGLEACGVAGGPVEDEGEAAAGARLGPDGGQGAAGVVVGGEPGPGEEGRVEAGAVAVVGGVPGGGGDGHRAGCHDAHGHLGGGRAEVAHRVAAGREAAGVPEQGEHRVRGGEGAHVGGRSPGVRGGEGFGGAARVAGPVVLRDDDEQPGRGVVVPEVGVVRGAQGGGPVAARRLGHGQALAGHRARQSDRFGAAAGCEAGEAHVPRSGVDRERRHPSPRFLNRNPHRDERSSWYAEAGG